jgi:tetratricopeptide (TPR) repeat protein
MSPLELSRNFAAAVAMLLSIEQAVAQDLSVCFGAEMPAATVVPACNSVIEADPRHAQAYQARGGAWYQLGKYDWAIADYTASLAIDPKYIRAYYNRGLAWEAEGNFRNALKDFLTFSELDPTFPDAQTAIARVRRQLSSAANTFERGTKPSIRAGQEVINMEPMGGVFVVPIRFNDVITLDAIVDSGASDVSVPADLVLTLMRSKTLTAADFLGEQTYILADGSKVPSHRFRIRSLQVGNKTIQDVIGSVGSVSATILLGQSFLRKFKSWSVDNEKHTLVLR